MKHTFALVAVVGLALTLTACDSKDGGVAQPAASSSTAAPTSSANPADSPEAVTWADNFCGSLAPLAALANVQPPDIKPGDIAGAHKVLSDMFGKFVPPLDGAVEGLKGLGPAPIKDGDAAKQTLLAALTPVRDEAKAAQEKFDKSKKTDRQAILDAAQSFEKIGGEMQAFDPSKSLNNTPELDALAAKAPKCKALGI
ncbi:MAG TPA: hypothetical protein VJX66_26485 [Amycolatopsis sp.]|nr:hypothetical protein [Amycolatopsis sp.]